MKKIKILSDNDRISTMDTAPQSVMITCGEETLTYSTDELTAVVIKTMDTGPTVEDMYAELYTNDAIYILLSESPNFRNTIIQTLCSVLPIQLDVFIEASMCPFNATFVVYKKENASIDLGEDDEKRAAILEASISLLKEKRQTTGLNGFIFAMLSFCPMYLLYGKGEHLDEIVTLSAISEKTIFLFTTCDKCIQNEQFEIRKFPAATYVKLLVFGENDAIVNFNTDYQLMLNASQLKEILLPLILLREDPVSYEKITITQAKSKKGLLSKWFKK